MVFISGGIDAPLEFNGTRIKGDHDTKNKNVNLFMVNSNSVL